MTPYFLIYLLSVSLCLVAFWLVYHLILSNLTHFNELRIYLLGSVVLSTLLPLIASFLDWNFINGRTLPMSDWHLSTSANVSVAVAESAGYSESSLNLFPSLINTVLLIYVIGVAYKTFLFSKHLWQIRQLIENNPKHYEGQYCITWLPHDRAAFSFLKHVFLPSQAGVLSADELKQVKAHELLHIQYKHSFDILFVEIVGVFLWFNPVMYLVKNALKEVHEFQVDRKMAGQGGRQKSYARLLLKLSSNNFMFPITPSFSGKKIDKRIRKLLAPRSLPGQKIRFACTLPAIAILFFFCSFINRASGMESLSDGDVGQQQFSLNNSFSQEKPKIGKITWIGNTVYDDKRLDKELGFKTGDVFDADLLSKRMNYNPDGKDISALYMDNGYLFFNIELKEEQIGEGTVNLILKIHEGEKFKIRKIIVEGNETIPDKDVLGQITFASGEVFSRAKLVEAQKAIANMGYFDPNNIRIQPLPDAQAGGTDGLVDIIFVVSEINKK